MRDDDLMKIPIPPELTSEDRAYNPGLDMPQYEWKTVGQYKDEKRMEWLKEHQKADAIVVNQEGTPLYALYTSPFGSHEEATHHLFKTLRANMLNEWEEEDYYTEYSDGTTEMGLKPPIEIKEKKKESK